MERVGSDGREADQLKAKDSLVKSVRRVIEGAKMKRKEKVTLPPKPANEAAKSVHKSKAVSSTA